MGSTLSHSKNLLKNILKTMARIAKRQVHPVIVRDSGFKHHHDFRFHHDHFEVYFFDLELKRAGLLPKKHILNSHDESSESIYPYAPNPS